MTKYQELIEKSEMYTVKASQQTDSRLTTFFVHAAVGFRQRAENMKLSEVIA